MNKIEIDLKNCYGINKLDYDFKFSNRNNAFVVYAPNGTMKTSFTRTLLDLKEDRTSKDRIFPERETKRVINKSDNSQLDKSEIFIVESYRETFESDKITSLLASKELKKEYDKINKSIESSKELLLKFLAKTSGLTAKNVEGQFSYDFTSNHKKIMETLDKIYTDNYTNDYEDLSYLKYKIVINDTVKKFLENEDVKTLLSEYMKKYNELMSESLLFKKGIFNHSNASVISKQLQANGFFNAKYKVIMGNDNQTIKSHKELNELIETAKKEILKDDELKSKFDKIDTQIKNKDLTELRKVLEINQELINELFDYNNLKKKIWISYLNSDANIKSSFESLVLLYRSSKEKIQEILKKARKEKTDWDNVVNIFNSRFNVPFIVEVENQEDVILKESAPTLKFKYKDKDSEKNLEKNQLIDILSQGEKRALYLLNIIFEIEGIKKQNKKTLIILDDIADSFDYKNKYAIVEYLRDIKEDKLYNIEEKLFNIIILTHNFDFYRTVANRVGAKTLMTSKDENNIALLKGGYIKNIFNTWKYDARQNVFNNEKIFISAITFVRNICEYIQEENSDNYMFLTNLLHIKSRTNKITIGELESVYNNVWTKEKQLNLDNKEMKVIDLIFKNADSISENLTETVNLEDKIVMSIAIRLKAEQYMIGRINNNEFIIGLEQESDQTWKLLKEFTKNFKTELDVIKKMEQVNLMTSENIHINSFMYEPLLDLSDHHLKTLYKEIKKLFVDLEAKVNLIHDSVAITIE